MDKENSGSGFFSKNSDLTNRFLFNRTFKEINFWEWIIVIMIIPLIFGYLYVNQGT